MLLTLTDVCYANTVSAVNMGSFSESALARVSELTQAMLMSFEVYQGLFTLDGLHCKELKAQRRSSELAMEKWAQLNLQVL